MNLTGRKTAASIAIIPDGNRRYARKHDLPLAAAYKKGYEKASEVLSWAYDRRVKSVSLWALSMENLNKRSKFELDVLFKLMRQNISEAFHSEELSSKGARVKFFGRLELLPKGLQDLMAQLERDTASNGKVELNVGVAYSGQDELVHASKLLAQDIASGKVSQSRLQKLSFTDFEPYLYIHTNPDLVIRTGDVQRLSGFLPFQSAYSEYYFSPVLWPEFSKEDFNGALDYYSSVQRRFGQ